MPFGRCQRLWAAPDSKYLVVPPYNCGVGAETVPWGQRDTGSIQSCWPSARWYQQCQRCACPNVFFLFHWQLWQDFWQNFERHCSFVSILYRLNFTFGHADVLLLHGKVFIPTMQHFDVSSAIVLLDVWLNIGECIWCISYVAEDVVVHRNIILLA